MLLFFTLRPYHPVESRVCSVVNFRTKKDIQIPFSTCYSTDLIFSVIHPWLSTRTEVHKFQRCHEHDLSVSFALPIWFC